MVVELAKVDFEEESFTWILARLIGEVLYCDSYEVIQLWDSTANSGV